MRVAFVDSTEQAIGDRFVPACSASIQMLGLMLDIVVIMALQSRLRPLRFYCQLFYLFLLDLSELNV